VYIEYSTLSIALTSLNVVDLNGKSVFTKKLGASTVGTNKTFVGLPSGLPEGFYVVHFFVGNQAFSKTISVHH
jgi:hypothetical protein